MTVKRTALVLGLALAALSLTLGAVAVAQSIQGDNREPTSALRDLYTFQGRVFQSPFADEGQPISGVVVQLHGANNPGPGQTTWIRETATDSNGWYSISVNDQDAVYEFYSVQEVDPNGYTSVGATSVSGTVVTANWIEFPYYVLSPDTTYTGNKFWDQAEFQDGWLEGRVLDGLSAGGLPTCSPAEVQVDPSGLVLPADPVTGHYGPGSLTPGEHIATASAVGYLSELVPLTIRGGATTVHDFHLARPNIMVMPGDFVSVTASISQPTTYSLTVANLGSAPLGFELIEDPSGVDIPWLWVDPVTGTVPPSSQVAADVTFHCTEAGDHAATLQVLHGDPCRGAVDIPVLLHCEAPPERWFKGVNGEPWQPELVVHAQTSDTIQIVDVLTGPAAYTLLETWNPDQLKLLDWSIDPLTGMVVTRTGYLEWSLPPDHPPMVTMTKWFHVEPCGWTETLLMEELQEPNAQPETRLVPIVKQPPELAIGSHYIPEVKAGQTVTFSLIYSNTGGYENGVVITNTFPPGAPFMRSEPPATASAADGSWARWEVGDLAGGVRATVDVVVGIGSSLPPSNTLVIWDGIYNHMGELAGETWIEFHVEPSLVEWDKVVQGFPWRPELIVTVQTSDTIVVVDIITLTLPTVLIEKWNPEHLGLQSWLIDPPLVAPVVEGGEIIWDFPPMPSTRVEITKWFHVKPCAWERTVLEELLFVEGAPELLARPVIIHKLPPVLSIDSVYPPEVFAGQPVTFTLIYSNSGGREFGAMIRNEFPREARFRESVPPANRAEPNGFWAEWDLPPLEMGGQGQIAVTVDVARQVQPSSTIEIWDGIFDHAGYLADGTVIRFHVNTPPVTFPGGDWPWYAQGEIRINPYPVHAGWPTEICVELINLTDEVQTAAVQFSWASFGIGLVFTPIDGIRPVTLPPHSTVVVCLNWVPPMSGRVCLQAELFQPGYPPQRSQRNMDVDEPLRPLTPHSMVFPVGNPLERPVTITLGLVPHLPDWGLELSQDVLPNLLPGQTLPVTLTVTPPALMPPDGEVIVDVEAYAERNLIGGFRKIFRPPVLLHRYPDPFYAEREISIDPYPPRAGEPTEICVELRNVSADAQTVTIQFSAALFGVGMPFIPVNVPQDVYLPPYSVVKQCMVLVRPVGGHFCVQVELMQEGYPPQRSQRNMDVDEPLRPLTPHSMVFPVGNPLERPVTITLGLVPHLPDWGLELSQDVLPNLLPGQTLPVTLTVTPPALMPPDGEVIVDVEAYAERNLIGGFRKIFRPPILVHRPPEPVYAESEIFVNPYPPREQEPTEVGVELRNITYQTYTVTVQFSAAPFGIGLPFNPIAGPIQVVLPPHSLVRPSLWWVPPVGGLWCFQVEVAVPGYPELFWSQRNIDIDEPLEPGVPHSRIVQVGNPYDHPVTITLGLIPHLPGWQLQLSSDVLADLKPAEFRPVTLTVTPPDTLPPDMHPIADIEAFVDGRLLGGFRKIYRPPVPIHRPKDPVYAESEIGVDPYPVVPGQPTIMSVELFNPTNEDRFVTVTFSIAPFGIGLPFSTADIAPNPIRLFVPRYGAGTGHVVWNPPAWQGKFCVRVTVQLAGHEPIWSQRNIDVGEPLRPGLPHALVFPVGNPTARPVTVTLGLVNHRPGWSSSLSDTELENLQPGETTAVTLTVTPASDARLGTGFPIVDVEGYVNGVLIGGFRKLDRPPIPIHKPHERSYAETEVIVDPYPPQQGQPSRVGAVVQNTGEVSWTIELEFGWADFGMGIPFTHTGMVPYTRSVTLSPHLTTTAWVTWTPSRSGHQCVQVHSIDAGGAYDPQFSQRNVDVEQRPPCGITKIYTVTIYNDSADQVTVDVGLITFNVPAEWQITVTPSSTLTLPPFGSGVITVALTIPCAAGRAQGAQEHIDRLQQEANSVPTINVEGYVDGQLLGGIQLQFPLSTSVQASFQAAPTEGVAPLTVVFTNTTVGDFDTVLWDLGDGVISTLENPTHTYAVGGVYTVSLTASGMGGTDTLVRARYITVYQPVVAEFSGAPTSGFVPLTVNWTNLSSGDYSTFGWDFGDGSTSAQQNPTHVYTSCGVFTVKLTVTGPGGTDEALREDYISARCGIFLPVLLRGP